MALSEQEHEEVVAYFLRGSSGDRLVEKVEQIIARHVTEARAAALDEAAGAVTSGCIGDPFAKPCKSCRDAARIVRNLANSPPP